jgi:hypothetical protein
VLNRCQPSLNEVVANKMLYENIARYLTNQLFQRIIIENYRQADIIGLSQIIAVILSLLLVFLLRYIVKVMIIITLILSCLGSIGKCIEGALEGLMN